MKKNKKLTNHTQISVYDRIADIKTQLQTLEETPVVTELDLIRKNEKILELRYQIETLFLKNSPEDFDKNKSSTFKSLKKTVKQYNDIIINNWIRAVLYDENQNLKSKSLVLCSVLQNDKIFVHKLHPDGRVEELIKYTTLTNINYIYKTYSNNLKYTCSIIDKHIIISIPEGCVISNRSEIITDRMVNWSKRFSKIINEFNEKTMSYELAQVDIHDFTLDLFQCDIGIALSLKSVKNLCIQLFNIKNVKFNQVLDMVWKFICKSYHQDSEFYNSKIQEVKQRELYNKITLSQDDKQFTDFIFAHKIHFDVSRTLYVHRGVISCQRNRHNIECVTAIVSTDVSDKSEINVNYCHNCNKYFISHGAYEIYRKRYNLIYLKFKIIHGDFIDKMYNDISFYSPLRLAGYNVNQISNFSDKYRREILSHIIDKGIMRKYEIIDYLEYFIRMHKYNAKSDVALEKWNKDLEFVKMYNFHKQRKVQITDIKRYNSGE